MSDEMTESMRQSMSLDGDVAKLTQFYDHWASNYDSDVGDHGYGLPASMVATLATAVQTLETSGVDITQFQPTAATVLDAGCGTGLVGVALSEAGYQTIDGVDLSAEMVQIARASGVYRRLHSGVDLTIEPADDLRQTADIVTVGGVFTVGHVPPEALEPIAQLVRPGGLLLVSTRQAYQGQTGYQDVSDRLANQGLFQLLCHQRDLPYTMDSVGDYWAYRVIDRS